MNYRSHHPEADSRLDAFLAGYAALCKDHGLMLQSYEGCWLETCGGRDVDEQVKELREGARREA